MALYVYVLRQQSWVSRMLIFCTYIKSLTCGIAPLTHPIRCFRVCTLAFNHNFFFPSCRVAWLISKPYVLAMLIACVEYVAELHFFPKLHGNAFLTSLGALMVVTGEILRKSGIISAKEAFTHQIATQRRENHQLVQHGIYSIMRHPGYAGWMLWAIGTQLILNNPLCTIGFAVITWRFMNKRIIYEEKILERFFGVQEYSSYRNVVKSGIPFIP